MTARVESQIAPHPCLPFSGDAVVHYAEIRLYLEKKGTPIGPHDLIIAATARAAGATMVTANTREFSRIPNLRCEDWTR